MSLFGVRVVGPVSPLSSALRVQGAVPGALVEVFAQGSGGGTNYVVARVTATAADQLFALLPGVRLVRGDRLSAIQFLGSQKSELTPEVQVVQVLPAPTAEDLGALVIRSIPHICGACLYVDGAYPGATVNVYAPSGLPRGTPVEAIGTLARLAVAPPGIDSPDLVVRQTHNTITGREVSLGTVQTASPTGKRPPPPQIEGPVQECDSALLITGVLSGATVTVKVRQRRQIIAAETSTCVDTPATYWEVSELKEGGTVTAVQALCGVESEESSPVPIGPLHAPRPWIQQPCEGDSVIDAHALKAGAVITLEASDASGTLVDTITGAAYAPSVKLLVPDGFLKRGMRLTMRASVCGVAGAWSPSVAVRRGKGATAPWIHGPLVGCQSRIRVFSVQPGALVKIISDRYANASELGCIGEAYATKSYVDISTIALVPGDVIWAVAYQCGKKEASVAEEVRGIPDATEPSLGPVFVSGPLRLDNLVPGALLEVFVDGRAVAREVTPIGRIALRPPPEMKLGSAVRVTQQACGQPARSSVEQRARTGTLTLVPGSAARLQQLTGDVDRGSKQPTLNRTFTRQGLPGMDLGVPIEHMGRCYLFFGDSKQSGADALIRPIAEVTSYPEDPETGLELTFLHVPGNPYALLPLRVLDIDVHLPMKTPVKTLQTGDDTFFVPSGGFSYDGNVYVFVMRKTAHPRLAGIGVSYGRDGYPSDAQPRLIGGRAIMAWARDPEDVFDSTEVCDVRDFSVREFPSRWKFAEVYAKVVPASSLPELRASGDILLLWGTGAYRESDICFAWVQPRPGRRVPGPEGWRFLSAFSPGGDPSFQTGDMAAAIGLMEYSDRRVQSVETTNPGGRTPGKYAFGEFSITYIPVMNTWLLLGAQFPGVVAWLADKPWGPWIPVGSGAHLFDVGALPEPVRPTGPYANYGLARYYQWDDGEGNEVLYHLCSFLGDNHGQVQLLRSRVIVQ